MRYPDFLPAGGTIGFPAPSFGANIEPYRSAFGGALAVFEERGFEAAVGENAYAGDGVGISTTPERCGAELTQMYCAPENDALISVGGGELMCETMNHVDLDAVRAAKPKWFQGFSDNTNFTFALTTLCDTAAVYGPCASSFGMRPWHQSLTDSLNVLTGATAEHAADGVVHVTSRGYSRYEVESKKDEQHPFEPYNCEKLAMRRVFSRGEMRLGDGAAYMEGRLLGGCMDILAMLVGTRFDAVAAFNERYRDDGVVWFLESCDLNPMSIRRALWQMESAGWFDTARGFLIGRPLCGHDAYLGLTPNEAVCGILGKYNVPIVMDVDFGHVPPAMPLISGSYVKASCMGNDVAVEHIFK